LVLGKPLTEIENSVTKKLVQAMQPYHFKKEDAGCLYS
jgi:hypothetical protein